MATRADGDYWAEPAPFPSTRTNLMLRPTGAAKAAVYEQFPSQTPAATQLSCAGGIATNGACGVFPGAPSGAGNAPFSGTPAQAIAAIPDSEKPKAVAPDAMADFINSAWKEASEKPGYAGTPWSPNNPVSADDVNRWRASNPNRYPTGNDLARPVTNPATGTASGSAAGGTPTGTGSGASMPNPGATNTDVKVDFGPDPGIGAPGMEGIPEAPSWLEPIKQAVPGGVLGWQMPAHTGACPVFAFDLWDRHFEGRVHCDLAEANRGAIGAIFLAFWTISAMMIFLRA